MLKQSMLKTVQHLFEGHKGILAMDESNVTCNLRFSQLDIPQNEEHRRLWRELIITTPGLNESIGGVILFDETVHQHQLDGTAFLDLLRKAGILFGIKVDQGIHPLALHPLEKITHGLDDLRERLHRYVALGAVFAKWRATVTIGDELPTSAAISANAHSLARYAALCQELGLVPVVEPEVLMSGSHTIERCQSVTKAFLAAVFEQLNQQGVELETMILKPNMVLPGAACGDQSSDTEIAMKTLDCLLHTVPAAVPAIAFLSGGQSSNQASSRLNAINLLAQQERGSEREKEIPWTLAFSFSRAIQSSAMTLWRGFPGQVSIAQNAILQHVQNNQLARRGRYIGPSPATIDLMVTPASTATFV